MTALTGLRSETFRLHARPDLLDYYEPHTGALFEHAARGVVGVGTALRIVVPEGPRLIERVADEAARALASIAWTDHPPIVMGALPFGSTRTAELVVPQIAIVRDGDTGRMIVTGRSGLPEPETMPHEVPPEPWDTLRVRPDSDPDAYVAAVAEARARIRAGALDKVVLARTVIAESDHVFDVPTLLSRLRSVEPAAYVFGVRGLVGATPELLVARHGTLLRANPLAGTSARAADTREDEAVARRLATSDKDLHEHRIVVEAVRATLEGITVSLDVPERPSTISTSKLWHLSTAIDGILSEPAPSALQIASVLHPTPAVCGTPRATALAMIEELEERDRGLYAGIVGWMDAAGDGEWAVTLRCAEIDGSRARLFAGAGIVADSDPHAELRETDAKFRGLLDALRYG